MLEVQNEISLRKNKAYLGKVFTLLIDGISKTDDKMLTGRADTAKVVNLPGRAGLAGSYRKVRITDARTWSLYGELV